MELVTTIPAPAPRSRQLRLFSVENPLGLRLGVDFFRGLPPKPGVYFFHDEAGALLYIGQSNDLRTRVGSYRHVTPERHPKRTLRLVHRIARIEWQECPTHAEAQELERVLLLEKRPPFNRAGVWSGYPWWLTTIASDDGIEVRLMRQPLSQCACIGPLPSGFRHVYGSLMRCTHRLLYPHLHFAAYPLGLLNYAIPLQLRLRTIDARRIASALNAFATGDGHEYLAELQAILPDASPLEMGFWMEELEVLLKFTVKAKQLPLSTLSFPVSHALPLFPDL
jgi:hypothetical protein